MDPSGKENDNKLNQFILPSKNLLSTTPHDSNQKMAQALRPELQGNGLLSGLSAIRTKHIAHSSHSPPSPCRTPTKPLPDISSLLASPLNVPAVTTCAPSQTSRDRVNEAPIHGKPSPFIRTADTNDHDTLNATGETRNGGMTSQQAKAIREGPEDLPPIAFLPEPPVSPEISTRALPGVSHDAGSRTEHADAKSSAPNPFAPITSGARAPARASTSATQIRAPSSSAFTFKHYRASPVPPSTARGRPSSVSRHGSTPRDAAARVTRAGSGASAHDPPPRYTFTYGSLMRRSTGAPERTAQSDYVVPAIRGQRELETACETMPASIGVLRGPPQIVADLHAFAALVEGLRGGQRDGEGMDVDGSESSGAAWWMQPRPNTAPTVGYAALLEDAFGPGSVLRGEGPKPMQRKAYGKKSKDRGRSTSNSGSEEPDMDVDTDASVDIMNVDRRGASRAQGWIAEIQMMVKVVQKGKRQLVREDLKLLRETLREIENMSAAEGNALGDDAPRLRESISQLAQLRDMPFRDEFPVCRRANQILDAWPAP